MVLDLFSKRLRAPAECIVEMAGGEISDLYPSLVEVTVDTDRRESSVATLAFETRRIEDGTWIIQDDPRFSPWSVMKIEAAFGNRREEVMRGYVREVRAEYPPDKGTATVTVTCQDESLKLDREHVNRPWGADAPTTDQVIVQEIARRHGLGMLAPPGSGQSGLVVNQNATDIRFLKDRAEANGYELHFREGKLYFGPMRIDSGAQATLLIYAGTDTNCIRFDVQDDGHMPDQVAYEIAVETGSGTNQRTVSPNLPVMGREPASSESAGLGDFVWRPTREGQADETQMEARAQHMANEQSLKVKVDGELDGSMYGHVLRVGEPVGVDGAGDRYSGTYYVDTAQHRFDVNGYVTTFRLLRNAYGDDLSSSIHPLAGIL